ncbi:MAG: hypothetical protein K8R86_09475 [Bacteroidales bacterium]|nr:hypothetical protein [Bacteroidales bacterium]
MENLLYRRQFVLSPNEISDRPGWTKYVISDKYNLYAHPDLVQTEYSEGNKRIILLGDMYDPINKSYNNHDIISRVLKNKSLNDIIESTFQYAGRFAIIVTIDSSVYIFNDASASRKVFYTTETGSIWCASQPHVLAEYCNIPKTKNEKALQFYKSDKFFSHDKVNIINNTIFDSIKQLLPNHYLDVQNKKHIRFWPTKKNKMVSLNEGVEEGTKILSGIITSANERNELMMAVTAGNDTRLLLAASKAVSDNIFYYINKIPRYDEKHQDMVIPQRLCDKIGVKFNILEFSKEVNDEEFKKIYFQNNIFAHERNLPLIYNVYHKRFPNKINMPGRFSDIARNFFNTYRKNITPELLATFWDYTGIEYVVEEYRKWLSTAGDLAKKYNYNILELFNWEERNGNLYTAFQVDKDIAQEEFTPYNCRRLMEVFLSVPNKYRDIHTNVYFRAMMKHLWPELVTIPFNPNLEKYTSYYLKKIGLYWTIRRFTRGW